ncbi:hypothetical protein ACWEO1_32205 [Kitasatospora cineracea]
MRTRRSTDPGRRRGPRRHGGRPGRLRRPRPWLLPAAGDGPLRATGEARRVELGEPECTGGCCGYLAAVVRRHGALVVWSDWETPADEPAPPDFHFDARQYDAELARATADRWWDVPPVP